MGPSTAVPILSVIRMTSKFMLKSKLQTGNWGTAREHAISVVGPGKAEGAPPSLYC